MEVGVGVDCTECHFSSVYAPHTSHFYCELESSGINQQLKLCQLEFFVQISKLSCFIFIPKALTHRLHIRFITWSSDSNTKYLHTYLVVFSIHSVTFLRLLFAFTVRLHLKEGWLCCWRDSPSLIDATVLSVPSVPHKTKYCHIFRMYWWSISSHNIPKCKCIFYVRHTAWWSIWLSIKKYTNVSQKCCPVATELALIFWKHFTFHPEAANYF